MYSSKPNILSQCQFNARVVFQYPTYIPITSSNQDVFSITNIFTYTIIYSNQGVFLKNKYLSTLQFSNQDASSISNIYQHRGVVLNNKHVHYLEQHPVSHRLYAYVCYLEQHHVSHRLYAHVCYLEQHHVSHRLYAHAC
jgi:ureidoglycolate hydrolase